MPQAIHESTVFNSRNRKVAIHCVFSVKDNTLIRSVLSFIYLSVKRLCQKEYSDSTKEDKGS